MIRRYISASQKMKRERKKEIEGSKLFLIIVHSIQGSCYMVAD